MINHHNIYNILSIIMMIKASNAYSLMLPYPANHHDKGINFHHDESNICKNILLVMINTGIKYMFLDVAHNQPHALGKWALTGFSTLSRSIVVGIWICGS